MNRPADIFKRYPLTRDLGQRGFTLVELITVMLLIGILSAVAISRFADTNLYRQALFTQQLQAYLRLTQQLAMARQSGDASSAEAAKFSLQQTAAQQWRVTISSAGSSQSHLLKADSQLFIDQQALTLGTDLQLSFASNGDLIAKNLPQHSPITHSIALQIGTQSICIAPTGYSYEGHCI